MTNYHKALRYCSLALIFLATLFIGFAIFYSTSPKLALKAQQWQNGSTKLNYMQSIFQLGAATSIAFALAGPQIRHVLGPKIKMIRLVIENAVGMEEGCTDQNNNIVHRLHFLEQHQQDLGEMQRGALYLIHLSAIAYNIVMLIWSSIIDPNGKIWNVGAVYLLIGCIGFPSIDLVQAYTNANPLRDLLRQVKSAFENRKSEEIDHVCKRIDDFITASPIDRFPI